MGNCNDNVQLQTAGIPLSEKPLFAPTDNRRVSSITSAETILSAEINESKEIPYTSMYENKSEIELDREKSNLGVLKIDNWIYQGFTHHGQMNGSGILKNDLMEMEGNFINNNPEGSFLIRYRDSLICMANFEKGKRHKRNILLSEGHGSLETYFENGKLSSECFLVYKGKRIRLIFQNNQLMVI